MKPPFVAVVGGETLLGREIREVLDIAYPHVSVRMLGEEQEDAAILTAVGDEPVVVTPLALEDLEDADVVILAGSKASSARATQILKKQRATAPVIDLTGYCETDPAAQVRAPFLEKPGEYSDFSGVQVIAHPAAMALAAAMTRLKEWAPVRRVVAQVFEPASERGLAGVQELEQQTVNLLSLKPLPKEVFGEQAAFNLLTRWGAEAAEPLEHTEQKILRHLHRLAGGGKHTSVRLVQAPVFHGYIVSVWVEMKGKVALDEAMEALMSPIFELSEPDDEPPNNVSVAGENTIQLAQLKPDPEERRAFWLWMAVDNLRLPARSAIEVAGPLLAFPKLIQ